MNQLDKLFSILKGGAGSGNFGHSRRPGKRGGSTSKGLLSIRNYQNELRQLNSNSDKERRIVVDILGDKILDVVGQEHSVTISKEEADKLNSRQGNFIDLHNHPNNNAPSSADYDSRLRFQPKEARVVTKEGIYILKPKDGIWFPGIKKDSMYGAGTSYYQSYNFYQSRGLKYPEGNSELLSKNTLNVILEQGWLDASFEEFS